MGDRYAARPRPRRTHPVRRQVTFARRHPDDIPAVVEQSRDPETVRWTTRAAGLHRGGRPGVSPARRRGARRGRRTTWAVEHDGGFAGLVSLRTQGDGVEEVSFAGHPAHRGRGLVTAAVRLMCALRLRARRAGGPLARAARQLRLTAGGLEGRVPDRGGPGVGRGAAGRGFAPGAGMGRPAAAGRGDGAGDPMAHGADDRGRRDPPSAVPGRGCGEHARRARRRDPVLLGRPAHPGLVRRLAARAAQPERRGQHPDLRGRRRDHRPPARRRRHRPPRRARSSRARGSSASGCCPTREVVAWWRRRSSCSSRMRGDPSTTAGWACTSSPPAARPATARRLGRCGERGSRSSAPSARPSGSTSRPTTPWCSTCWRPTTATPDGSSPGRLPVIETEPVPPAPLDVPGRPRRGRGSRPREPALHAAGRPPRRGDVPQRGCAGGSSGRTATSTSTGRSPTARPTTPSAT